MGIFQARECTLNLGLQNTVVLYSQSLHAASSLGQDPLPPVDRDSATYASQPLSYVSHLCSVGEGAHNHEGAVSASPPSPPEPSSAV